MVSTLPKRQDVPEEMKWDATSIYATPEAWQAATKQVAEDMEKVSRYQGKLGSSADTLLEGLKARDALLVETNRIGQWAMMYHVPDMNNQEAIARFGQAQILYGKAGAAVAFFEPEILEIGADKLKTMLKEQPALGEYEHYFDKLESQRAHIRSAEVEGVLAEAADLADSGYTIYNALSDSDLKLGTIEDENGKKVELGQSNIITLIRNRNRPVRKAAWESMSDAYLGMKNTFAATLSSGVKRDVFYAQAHRYSSSLEAALSADNVPTEVFYKVVDTFRKHLPVWHRYWEIKRRGLGVDKLHGYDIDVPLVRSERKISYDEAVQIVLEGMAPLGDEYIEPLRRGLLEQRWVDVLPNEGKGGGAFSSGGPGTHPFLFISYDDTLENVSTLAHELGHSMHSYLTWKNQPAVYGNYSMFAAETASNFNQAMVRANLLANGKDEDFELEVLAEAMSNFHRYLFIMPTLARFEIECHERVERGEGLTADAMSSLMADLYTEAYGPSVEVDRDRVGITWAEFPHMFGNFYVFQYTTGISAANALADGVLRDGKDAAERYLSFLRAGDAVYPIDALKMAGIDMNTPEPVERAFAVLTRMIDRLDQLVGNGPLQSK
ncbi:MAG: oligoendopeptidase F [Chloroflexota bacterium]